MQQHMMQGTIDALGGSHFSDMIRHTEYNSSARVSEHRNSALQTRKSMVRTGLATSQEGSRLEWPWASWPNQPDMISEDPEVALNWIFDNEPLHPPPNSSGGFDSPVPVSRGWIWEQHINCGGSTTRAWFAERHDIGSKSCEPWDGAGDGQIMVGGPDWPHPGASKEESLQACACVLKQCNPGGVERPVGDCVFFEWYEDLGCRIFKSCKNPTDDVPGVRKLVYQNIFSFVGRS